MVLFDWKSVFILILIIFIGWYLLTTDTGKSYLNVIRSKLSVFFASLNLPSISGIFGAGPVETDNTTMYLSVQSNLFDGKSFDVKDSTFTGIGTCDLSVASSINVRSQNIWINITSGKVILNEENGIMMVNIHGVSSGFNISEQNTIYPTDKGFDIDVNCNSTNFIVTDILESKITLNGADGNVVGDKGTLKLTNDTVEVDGFKGSLQTLGNIVNLNGTILKILLNGEKAII
jgi:hypothetical protein